MVGFVLKVMGLSIALSIAIKYGGPWLPVSGNTPTVLGAIGLPSLVMAIALGWRWQLGKGMRNEE
jgi:hypothetical protein